MLDGSGEHQDVTSLSLYLDGVFEELFSVIRIARVDMGPGSDCSAAILLGEAK